VGRKLTLCLLTSIFLLLCGVAVQAAAKDVKLDDVSTQAIIVNGMVDKPYVNITVLDPKTNQIIGQEFAKADLQSMFSTKIQFSAPLKAYNDLVLSVTDSDDKGNKTTTVYRLVLDCWAVQQTIHQDDPCNWVLYSPGLGGDTMG
jgi:hypothetical protein